MPPKPSQPPPKPLPSGMNIRTLAMMAVVYVVIAATLTTKPDQDFSYSTASVGVISYLIVEGASLLSEAVRVYSLAHDGNGPPAYMGYLTKTLAGMIIFGGAFGRVDVAWEAVSTLRALLSQLQSTFSGKL
ncbi:hypothetical protein QM012_005454 [Aureobasidium pullulans]|uniref:CASP-like protein n=1 Tax=Aureobasidium pullulans TaxID=5580 RepID=A0ABR0T4S7_AURPU